MDLSDLPFDPLSAAVKDLTAPYNQGLEVLDGDEEEDFDPLDDVDIASEVEKLLDKVNYDKYYDGSYVPSPHAVAMLDFINECYPPELYPEGLGYPTPAAHLEIYDAHGSEEFEANILAARGMAKSTTTKFQILRTAVYGNTLIGKEGIEKAIRFMVYISDSIDNGVDTMRQDLQTTIENNEFLSANLEINFKKDEWKFKSKITGKEFIVKGFGVKTGIRGIRRLGTRPQYILLDDLMSDTDGLSDVLLEKINGIIDSAVEFLGEPDAYIRLMGTPFDIKDPLYIRIANGIGHSVVIPICEKFPCTKEEFRGAWEERYPYEWVLRKYNNARKRNKFGGFKRELMLRIGTEAEKSVNIKENIDWVSINSINLDECNIYITTDLATGLRKDMDFLVILVWAIAPNKVRYVIDGWCEVEPIDKAITKLFEFAEKYDPISVGIESSGQQGGFIRWIYERMDEKKVFFNIASNSKGVAGYSTNKETVGLYPVVNKLQRFNYTLPIFKLKRFGMIREYLKLPWMVELLTEIMGATRNNLTSRFDDAIDAFSQIMAMDIAVPFDQGINPQKQNVKRDKNLYNNPYGDVLPNYFNGEYREIYDDDPYILEY